jgi:lysozyme family protein
MANFELALAKTLAHEGGYSNDSDDPGGMTYCGISRRAWPKWEGWRYADNRAASSPSVQATIRDYEYLQKLVADFYCANFWLPIHGDEIESQEIAEYLFDFAVNSGVSDAVKALQQANNRWFPDSPLKVDGIIGHDTITSLFVYNDSPHAFMDTFKTFRLAHYMNAIADNPKLAKFARGWVARALA